MILHCVLLKFSGDVSPARRQGLYDEVAALRAVVPGMLACRSGANVSPEGLGHGFADGFVVTFVDAAARDGYLVHPAHVAVGGKIVAATEGGLDGVLVYDLDVGSEAL